MSKIGLRHRSKSSAGGSSHDDGGGSVTDDEEIVDSEQGNVLSHIISQLRPGADLSRVTLPTFILEPRSMLERITNFMAHPDTLLPIQKVQDPRQRFVAVTKFYLSGWHIKPPGVKKPLNPILGETFTGYWDYEDGTKGYYISEQTSHHPPKSSYFYMAPEHKLRIDGTLKPRSKFLGNSVGSFMEGIAVMRFLDWKERYFITQPNMYARGILFGKMKYELGDHAQVRCPESGLEVDIEFKVKGWVSGSYNSIGGFIKETKTGKNLYELSGYWHGEMTIKDLATGKKEVLFDATRAKPTYPKARPLEEQAPRESQKLWNSTTQAIKKADQKTATDEKSRIEDEQRREAAEREQKHEEWKPHLFKKAPLGDEEQLDWIIDATVDEQAPFEKQVEQILAIAPVVPGQKVGEDFQQDMRLPSQQGKPLLKEAEKHSQTPPQADGGGDLIDFGQSDAPTSFPSTSNTSSGAQQKSLARPSGSTIDFAPSQPGQPAAKLQQPLVPTQSSTQKSELGDPLRRTDSLGNGEEDLFLDAES